MDLMHDLRYMGSPTTLELPLSVDFIALPDGCFLETKVVVLLRCSIDFMIIAKVWEGAYQGFHWIIFFSLLISLVINSDTKFQF